MKPDLQRALDQILATTDMPEENFGKPRTEPGTQAQPRPPRHEVDAAEQRLFDEMAEALAEITGENEANKLMEHYMKQRRKEPTLSEYEQSLLRRAEAKSGRAM